MFFKIPKLAGYLNTGELLKVFVAAHVWAGLAGAAVAILSGIQANAGAIFPNALVAFIVSQIIGLAIGAITKIPTGAKVVTPTQFASLAPGDVIDFGDGPHRVDEITPHGTVKATAMPHLAIEGPPVVFPPADALKPYVDVPDHTASV